MPLQWSEPMPSNETCCYDHVVAETPLGEIRLEWKGWHDLGDPPSGEMPWGEVIDGSDLAEAKQKAQAAWDQMIPKLTALCS